MGRGKGVVWRVARTKGWMKIIVKVGRRVASDRQRFGGCSGEKQQSSFHFLFFCFFYFFSISLLIERETLLRGQRSFRPYHHLS